MDEKLVHACKAPCACKYVWVIEGTEPKSIPQIHLELFQGIASDLQEVLGSDVSKENSNFNMYKNYITMHILTIYIGLAHT